MRTQIALGAALMLALVSVGCTSEKADGKTDGGAAEAAVEGYDRPGFKTFEVDGRLWVFQEGSEGLAEYEASGEPGKSVTMVGEGPNGMTIRSDDKAVIAAYMAAY